MNVQRYSVYAPGPGWTYEDFRLAARSSEQLGFSGFWLMDNSVGPDEAFRDVPTLDTWTLLPALAEATSSIRFGTLVTPVGRRHPALMAKITASFDRISGGRLDLGLGAGDHADYFVPWGQAYPEGAERVRLLRDLCEVLLRMWSDERASYVGAEVTLDAAINEPKPLQQPHPPIWIGLTRSRKLMPRLAARYADGINVYLPDEPAAAMLERVRDACAEIGRNPRDLQTSRNFYVAVTDGTISPAEAVRVEAVAAGVSPKAHLEHLSEYENIVVGTPEHLVEQVRTRAAGYDEVIFNFGGDGDGMWFLATAESYRRQLLRFGKEVLPQLRAFA